MNKSAKTVTKLAVSRASTFLFLGASLLFVAGCSKSALGWKNEIQETKDAITKSGITTWLGINARNGILATTNRHELLAQIQSQMPALPGRTDFKCWIEKDTGTGEDILVGYWLTGLTATGVMVGSTNYSPFASAWPRYHFEQLTNGVYLFQTSN